MLIATSAYWCLRRHFYVPAPPVVSDCVTVLGAATRKGKLTPDFERRVKYAKSLYDQGLVKAMITTGDHTPDEPYTCAETAARWLHNHGVPAENLYVELDSERWHCTGSKPR